MKAKVKRKSARSVAQSKAKAEAKKPEDLGDCYEATVFEVPKRAGKNWLPHPPNGKHFIKRLHYSPSSRESALEDVEEYNSEAVARKSPLRAFVMIDTTMRQACSIAKEVETVLSAIERDGRLFSGSCWPSYSDSCARQRGISFHFSMKHDVRVFDVTSITAESLLRQLVAEVQASASDQVWRIRRQLEKVVAAKGGAA